jgi:hypothetical protein
MKLTVVEMIVVIGEVAIFICKVIVVIVEVVVYQIWMPGSDPAVGGSIGGRVSWWSLLYKCFGCRGEEREELRGERVRKGRRGEEEGRRGEARETGSAVSVA